MARGPAVGRVGRGSHEFLFTLSANKENRGAGSSADVRDRPSLARLMAQSSATFLIRVVVAHFDRAKRPMPQRDQVAGPDGWDRPTGSWASHPNEPVLARSGRRVVLAAGSVQAHGE